MMNHMNESIESSANHIFEVMAGRVCDTDLQLIRRAYELAAEAHSSQLRKTGEPYIIHPIAVAAIAAEELELDTSSVCAAFLHDVVEDTPYTVEDIRERFGGDVAFLVDAVTKRKKEDYKLSKQIDNYRQILQSVNYDVRALLVKLSDRLHNMRTLGSMKPAKQMKIAGETDFFYAPLAGRLGLYAVKSELENLSFAYRCPEQFAALSAKLEEDKAKAEVGLKAFTAEVQEVLSARGITCGVDVRYRKPYSIWRDMMESRCYDFEAVEYKQYVRVTFSEAEGLRLEEKDLAFLIYSILTSHFNERPGSAKNYIDKPKSNGYQGLHVTLLDHQGVWQEVHISSERMRRNSQLGCILDRSEGWLERFREELKDIADNDENATIFMQGLKTDLYNEDIICYTPRGKGIILPKGATVLDFAYELHTALGNHARYAKVNGEISPVSRSLTRGDCVEIFTSDEVHPKLEWMAIVHSYKAQKRLRDALRGIPELPFQRCAECNPLPGEEVIGIKDEKGNLTVHRKNCSHAIMSASGGGDNVIVPVTFLPDERSYPVHIAIKAIDRYHLLRDILDCLVEGQQLSMHDIRSVSQEEIVSCDIAFRVHSAQQLASVVESIRKIEGIASVQLPYGF